MDTTANTTPLKTILVHRDGEEGAIQIDAHAGTVLDTHDAPDWAEGLVCALTASHLGHYKARLGNGYEMPGVLNYADLDWVGIDEDGNPTELTADPEYRADRLASILHLETDIDKLDMTTAKTDTTVTEVLISMDVNRSPEEIAAFEQSQKEGFGSRLTGTR